MLQLVQSALRRQVRVRGASSRSELLHQLQQVQNPPAGECAVTKGARAQSGPGKPRASFNYETSLVRSRANSWSVIDPDFLSRSSFSISSATLKPTTLRSSS